MSKVTPIQTALDERCRRFCEYLIQVKIELKKKFLINVTTHGIVAAMISCEEFLVAELKGQHAQAVLQLVESKSNPLSWSDALDRVIKELEHNLSRNRFDHAINEDMRLIQVSQRRAASKFVGEGSKVISSELNRER